MRESSPERRAGRRRGRSAERKALLLLLLLLVPPAGARPPCAAPGPRQPRRTTSGKQRLTPLWQRSNPGGGGAFNCIGGGPSGILFAASDLSGLYRSTDCGASWTVIGALQGLTATHVSALGLDPSDGSLVLLGTDEGIFRSTDGGLSFDPVLSEGYVLAIALAPAEPAHGYAAWHSSYDTADGVIYATSDHGAHWQRISDDTLPPDLRILKIEVDPRDPEVLYILTGEDRFACGPGAVFQSTDGGRTWSRIAANLGQIADLALDPADPDALYLTLFDSSGSVVAETMQPI